MPVAIVVPCLDIGPMSQQQFRYVLSAVFRRLMHRRRAVFVLVIDLAVVGEQRFDLFQIAFPGRLINISF
jgi:hypothetical protein